ncbi:DUF3472 domain-containing protein [Pseudomonas putida]|uniref:DUF3472 domain-containing protein n=1 Tax=Pseudomonas putida TaxID=303 RepID=UPI003D995941
MESYLDKLKPIENLTDPTRPDDGPHVSAVFAESSAELIYFEQRIAVGTDYAGIYWCGSNFALGRWGGYAGLQTNGGAIIGGNPYFNNNICSVWGVGGVNPGLEYRSPKLFSNIFTGEGVGRHTSDPMPWVPGKTYATAIRRWYKPGENLTRMATFIYSFDDLKWTHYSTMTIPERDVSFQGKTTAGFLERFGGSASRYQGIWGAQFRMNQNGTWQVPQYYEGAAGGNRPWTWDILPHGDGKWGEVLVVCGGQNSNTENYKKVYVRPSYDKPRPLSLRIAVMTMVATYQNGRVKVDWTIDDELTPQLSYELKLRTSSATGPVLVTVSDSVPERRSATFDKSLSPGTYYVSLELHDIFNQKSNYGYTSFVV